MKKKFRGWIIRLYDKNNNEFDSLSVYDIEKYEDIQKEIIEYDLNYNKEFYEESLKAERIIIERMYY